MTAGLTIVVCGSIVPDPLQTLEPIAGERPALKNEAMLPVVLDPWAAHSLFEAANLAKQVAGSKVYLVSMGPRAKLQQLMMTIAQKVSFELVAVDGSASGFTDPREVATALAEAIEAIPNLDRTKMLLFGGMASASRDAGVTMPMLAERLGIRTQFLGVDEIAYQADGSFRVKERVEGGRYLVSECSSTPAMLAWATGNLPEPPNNPQLGMMNMRGIMPALQKAKTAALSGAELNFLNVEIPSQRRDTRIVKNVSPAEVAKEIVEWMKN